MWAAPFALFDCCTLSSPAAASPRSALVCFADFSCLLVRRCVITYARWGACQVSIGVHVCSAASVTRGVATWRSGGGESGVRAWPYVVGSGGAAAIIMMLRRTSESNTIVPGAWGKPHQKHRHGQVSLGLEMEGSASRRLALLEVPACRWDDGPRK